MIPRPAIGVDESQSGRNLGRQTAAVINVEETSPSVPAIMQQTHLAEVSPAAQLEDQSELATLANIFCMTRSDSIGSERIVHSPIEATSDCEACDSPIFIKPCKEEFPRR